MKKILLLSFLLIFVVVLGFSQQPVIDTSAKKPAIRLEEVKVSGRKATLNASIDRKIYNVQSDIMAQSGSAGDILRNIPSVEVDIEGQVSLRGSEDVMILINGKPSPLMGKTRAEALQQMPANMIERIEIITNPSAKYRPDGTSGIINIVMKKNLIAGLHGTVTGNAGNRDRYNGNINLNYKPGKLSLSTSYSAKQDNRTRTSLIDRTLFDAGRIIGYSRDDYTGPSKPFSNLVSMGVEYAADKSNTFGVNANYIKRKMIKLDRNEKFVYDQNNILTSHFIRNRNAPEIEEEVDATASWHHTFAKEDQELSVEVNASADDETEDNNFTTVNKDPSVPKIFDNTFIGIKDHQQQITIDYTHPLSDDSKLELGYSGGFVQQDLNFFAEYFDAGLNKFVKDMVRSNRFIYKDQVHAFYGTYERVINKFGFMAGARLEQALIKGNLVTKDSLISNNYFKIYPTLHLSYALNKNEIQLNYSRRVNRPEADELNPFPEYQDPRNLQAGNPKLLPEVIHSIETGFKWQHKKFSFVPSLYYRYKQNAFTTVIIKLNDTTLLTTRQNLSNDQSAGLELVFSLKGGSLFNVNFNSNIFYNTIDASELGYSAKRSIISTSNNMNATFTLSQQTMLQVSSTYRSARLTPQGKTFGSVVFNAGVRQDLFDKKVSVVLTGSDIFKTQKQKTELLSGTLKQVSVSRRDARIFYLGVSYRFGKTKQKVDEKLQFDDSL